MSATELLKSDSICKSYAQTRNTFCRTRESVQCNFFIFDDVTFIGLPTLSRLRPGDPSPPFPSFPSFPPLPCPLPSPPLPFP